MSAPRENREDARRYMCGLFHTFSRRRPAVGYFDQPHDDNYTVRLFVCARHARQAGKEGHTVVLNGGFWPDA